MTNGQIIFNQAQALAEQGLINYTGRTLKAVINGEEVEIPEAEPIHTYKEWQKLGYQVRKGEKAVARFMIWMHTGRKLVQVPGENGQPVNVEDGGHYYRKEACFFAYHQVKTA